jgi:hypothetical protein
VRGIRVIPLVLAAVAVAGSAQSQVAFERVAAPPAATSEDIVARLLSFDRDGDGRVERDELNERMKALVTRGDADRDGALDGNEIRNLARTPMPAAGPGAGFPGLYQVPMDTWFPDRTHIDGALADLKLASEMYPRALAVVESHEPRVDAVARKARGELLRQMESVLTIEQLGEFQTVLDRQRTRPFNTIAGLIRVSGARHDVGTALSIADRGNPAAAVRQSLMAGDPDKLIDHYGLPPEQNRQAHAVLDRYRANLRTLGQGERAALVARMKDVLTEEQRDDFRAALERRSAVPVGLFGRPGNAPARGTGVISIAPPFAAPPSVP